MRPFSLGRTDRSDRQGRQILRMGDSASSSLCEYESHSLGDPFCWLGAPSLADLAVEAPIKEAVEAQIKKEGREERAQNQPALISYAPCM